MAQGWRGILGGVFSAVLISFPSYADPAVDPEARPLEEERVAPAEPKSAADAPALKVFGRVQARATADERQAFERQLGVSSARIGVEATFKNLEAVVEADLSSTSLLRDAYVRFHDDGDRYRLYAGKFKAPFLARELHSSWKLPLVSRGLVNDFIVDTHDLGGRRYGLMGEARFKQWSNLEASFGVFRGHFDDTVRRYQGEDAAGRVSMKVFKGLTLGASGYLAEALQGRTQRFAYGADATYRLGRFEVTGEALQGRVLSGRINAGVLLARYDIALDAKREWVVQPLLGAEVLQLRAAEVGTGHSVTGGVNLIHAETFKVQVQVERALRPGDDMARHEVALQVGARF